MFKRDFIENLKEWIALEGVVLGDYDRQLKDLDHNKSADECTKKPEDDCTTPCEWYASSKKENQLCVNSSFLKKIRAGNTILGTNKEKYDILHTDKVDLVSDEDKKIMEVYYVVFLSRATNKKFVIFNSGSIIDFENLHGFSVAGADSDALKKMIQNLVNTIISDTEHKYIVAGHSMGGQATVQVAAKLRDQNAGVFQNTQFICSGLYHFSHNLVSLPNIHVFYAGEYDADTAVLSGNRFDIDPFIYKLTAAQGVKLYFPVYVLVMSDDEDEDEDSMIVNFKVVKIKNNGELRKKTRNLDIKSLHSWNQYARRFKILIESRAGATAAAAAAAAESYEEKSSENREPAVVAAAAAVEPSRKTRYSLFKNLFKSRRRRSSNTGQSKKYNILSRIRFTRKKRSSTRGGGRRRKM
jgi:putative lipoic acid-binding regulatory protein